MLAYRVYPARVESRISLLCLHGFLGRGEVFSFLVDLALDYVDVITVDLPFHGDSRDYDGDLSLSGMLQEILVLIAHLGLSNVWVYGYSLGGRVAMQMASEWSGMQGLIIESAHVGFELDSDRQASALVLQERLKLYTSMTMDVFLSSWVDQDLFCVSSGLISDADWAYRKSLELEAMLAVYSACHVSKQPCFLPVLDRLDCPVFCVYGKKDSKYLNLTKLWGLDELGCKTMLVKSADHTVHLSAKNTMSSLILECVK